MVLDAPEERITNTIYDIYVIKTSGLPLFAGCTATEYCKTHMGQHELISGFFSALFSFSEESFKDDQLQTMLYRNIQLNFRKDDENDLIFIFVHDRYSDVNLIREALQQAHQIFINEYTDEIDKFSIDQTKFENFRDLLRENGIVKTDLQDTSGMMKIKGKHEEKSPRLVQWLKNIFSR